MPRSQEDDGDDDADAVCEQGNLQVFFQDLPLSIQDGYERFLSSSSVSLLQYQVQVEAEAMVMEECAAKRKTTKNATVFFFFFFFKSRRCSGI